MHLLDDLAAEPNALAEHYKHFRVGRRLLLTGHSHQCWPDVGREAHLRAFDDAARWVDQKWSRAFEQAERVKEGFRQLLGDRTGTLALAANTHELLIRWLSALDLGARPKLVTTDGEFHSIRRQLERLEEEKIEVVRVDSDDAATLAERLAGEVDDRTAAVLVSTVLFRNARIVPGLGQVLKATERHGAELLVDTYHQLAVLPFNLEAAGLGGAFAVGGGYKYCQLGEGNCFLRVPPGRDLRPVITGWYAEFEDLQAAPSGSVAYGRGAAAFAGATYDPTSHYRAAAVFDFFDQQGLDADFLRQVSQHQVGRLIEKFDALDLPPSLISRPDVPLVELGGFLMLQSPVAAELAESLREQGVSTDSRGDALRFGPAPYLADRQLDDAMAALGEVAKERSR